MKVLLIMIGFMIARNGECIETPNLHHVSKKIENEMNEISSLNSKAKAFARKFSKLSKEHNHLFVKYTNQKKECENLNKTLRYRQPYASRNLKLKINRVNQCYENLKKLHSNYQIINRDFIRLGKHIQLMFDMTETDLSRLPSMEKQLDTIQKILAIDEAQINFALKHRRYTNDYE